MLPHCIVLLCVREAGSLRAGCGRSIIAVASFLFIFWATIRVWVHRSVVLTPLIWLWFMAFDYGLVLLLLVLTSSPVCIVFHVFTCSKRASQEARGHGIESTIVCSCQCGPSPTALVFCYLLQN